MERSSINSPLSVRLNYLQKYLDYLETCRDFSFDEFISAPKIFGGAIRFIQMISKFAADISAQLAFEKKPEYPAEFALPLAELHKYYYFATLKDVTLKETYEFIPKLIEFIPRYIAAVGKYA